MATTVPFEPQETSLSAATLALLDGGLVVFRTDTLYGVSADPRQALGMERLRSLKGRDHSRGFVSLADSLERVRECSAGFSPKMMEFASRFWPGPLTLVLSAGPRLPAGCIQDDDSWAARVPEDAWCRDLARRLGGVLPSSSANLPGFPPARDAAEAGEALGEALHLVVDRGEVPGNTPASALVDLRGSEPRVLRAGSLELTSWLREWGAAGQS